MPKLHVVWDVAKARPMSSPLLYATAAQHADALEDAKHRAFIVLPAQDVAVSL